MRDAPYTTDVSNAGVNRGHHPKVYGDDEGLYEKRRQSPPPRKHLLTEVIGTRSGRFSYEDQGDKDRRQNKGYLRPVGDEHHYDYDPDRHKGKHRQRNSPPRRIERELEGLNVHPVGYYNNEGRLIHDNSFDRAPEIMDSEVPGMDLEYEYERGSHGRPSDRHHRPQNDTIAHAYEPVRDSLQYGARKARDRTQNIIDKARHRYRSRSRDKRRR